MLRGSFELYNLVPDDRGFSRGGTTLRRQKLGDFMTLFLRWATTCVLFVVLAACATKPPVIPYDRTSSNPVKKIGIVTP
jgi:hypothetical protein